MARLDRLMPLSLLLAGVSACASSEEHRWARGHTPSFSAVPQPPAESRFEWMKPSVAVYSFETPTPSSSPASLKDLSDHGQAALIEAMTKEGAKPDDIREALAKPLASRPTASEGQASQEGSYKRTLVATVTKGWEAGIADRLVRTWIEIVPRNFLFEGYSIIATDNQVLNIAQVTSTNGASLQGTAGRTASDTNAATTAQQPLTQVLTEVLSGTLGATANVSTQRVTNATIIQQYTKLGADILPTELRIIRESERNLDVSGNTLIALTMRVDPQAWQSGGASTTGPLIDTTQRVTKLKLLKDDGTPAGAADVVFEVALNKAPPSCPLVADVNLYYELRRVTGNARSYSEGRQRAEYVRAVTSAKDPVIILPADMVRRPGWRLRNGNTELQVRDNLGRNQVVEFASYEQAQSFADWLSQQPRSGGGEPRLGKAGLRLSIGTDTNPLALGSFTPERRSDATDPALCSELEERFKLSHRRS